MVNLLSVALRKSIVRGDQVRVNDDLTTVSASNIDVVAATTKQADGNDTWWYSAGIQNGLGRDLQFSVECPSHFQSFGSPRVNAWIGDGIDTDNWIAITDVNVLNSDNIERTASGIIPFGQAFLSHYPMYPYQRSVRMIMRWAIHRQVVPPASSDKGFVIGKQPALTDPVGGREIPELAAYGLKIEGTRTDKNIAVLTVGVHSGETLAHWSYEGMIDYILFSADEAAKGLREYWDFFLYPTIDPQQQWAGYFRTTPEAHNSLVMNREWDTADVSAYNIHRDAWDMDLGPDSVDIAWDHHNAHGSKRLFYFRDSAGQALENAIEAYVPHTNIDSPSSFSGNPTLTGYMSDNHLKSGGLRLTLESDNAATSVQQLKDIGSAQAKGLWDRTVAGDFAHGPNN